jgi:murein DD-endopeptidase MepM/ murein hydrolase activator NlpD
MSDRQGIKQATKQETLIRHLRLIIVLKSLSFLLLNAPTLLNAQSSKSDKIFTGDLAQCQVVLEVKKPTFPYGSPQFKYVSPDKENSEAFGGGCHIDRGIKLCLLSGTEYAQIPAQYRDNAGASGVNGWRPKEGSDVRVKMLPSAIAEVDDANPYMASFMWGRCSLAAKKFKEDKARLAQESLDDLELHLLEKKSLMSFVNEDSIDRDDNEIFIVEQTEAKVHDTVVRTRAQQLMKDVANQFNGMQGVVKYRPELFNVHINPHSPIPGLVTWKVEDTTFTFPLFTDASVSGGFRERRTKGKRHQGLDFGTDGAPSPVFAIADGIIIKAKQCTSKARGKCGAGFGNHIDLSIPALGCVVRYAHLNPKCMSGKMTDLKVGQYVRYGDHLACVGNTGKSTGPHLHLEINCPKEMAYGKNPIRTRFSDYSSDRDLYIADPEDFIPTEPFRLETEVLTYY